MLTINHNKAFFNNHSERESVVAEMAAAIKLSLNETDSNDDEHDAGELRQRDMWQRLLLCHRRHHHERRQRHRPLHTWWADGVSSFTASLPTHEHVLCSHRCLQRSVATPPNILAYRTASHWEYVNALLLVDFLSCSNSNFSASADARSIG